MSRRSELKQKILRHILLFGKAARPELVSLTGVRAATVFEVIDELKAGRIIGEPERRSKKTGRRAPELVCIPDCCYTVGVELRVSGCTGVIINASGTVIYHVDHPAERRKTMHDVKREILSILQHLRDLAGDDWFLVRGIGFADPGLVDMARNYSIQAVNIPGWHDVETGKMLENAAGLPAGVWSGAAVKTRMEYLNRLPSAPESIFNLITADGIGGGFIKNGELFFSKSGRAMEIGHIVVDPGGMQCCCGNRGCLEASASPVWLAEQITRARAAGADLGGFPEKFSMKLFAEYISENPEIQKIAEIMIRNICRALSTTVMLLNPDVIVISGTLACLGKFLTESLRSELESTCFPETVRNLKIIISDLKPEDTARGAAIMMRDRILLGGIDRI